MTDRKCDASSSADIIAFPSRVKAPEPAPAGDAGERLRLALLALDNAVKNQRAAVVDWRVAIGDLRQTMQTLGSSLNRYEATLGTIGVDAATLARAAQRMQAQAITLEAATQD